MERINKTISGAVELDLIHFPIDENGASVVALAVDAATGAGYTLATGRDDFDCDDTGRREDTTPLSDVGGNLPGLPAASNFLRIPTISWTLNNSPEGSSNDGAGNPPDPFGTPPQPTIGGASDPITFGDQLTLGSICEGMSNNWYVVDGSGNVLRTYSGFDAFTIAPLLS